MISILCSTRQVRNGMEVTPIGGLIGCGDGFVYRDPSGIRPGFLLQRRGLHLRCIRKTCYEQALGLDVADIKS